MPEPVVRQNLIRLAHWTTCVEIGESLTRSPLDGPRETRSPDTNEETPRPATG
jgi:hypothetical protein